jgi:hypothetical protein
MYAIVRDTPASWHSYRPPFSEPGDYAPDGLLICVAGPTAEGVRVIEVWGSRDDLRRHERERARSEKQSVPIPLRTEIVRELEVAYVLAPQRARPCGEPRRDDHKEEAC